MKSKTTLSYKVIIMPDKTTKQNNNTIRRAGQKHVKTTRDRCAITKTRLFEYIKSDYF